MYAAGRPCPVEFPPTKMERERPLCCVCIAVPGGKGNAGETRWGHAEPERLVALIARNMRKVKHARKFFSE
jgi:hypothetical protein